MERFRNFVNRFRNSRVAFLAAMDASERLRFSYIEQLLVGEQGAQKLSNVWHVAMAVVRGN